MQTAKKYDKDSQDLNLLSWMAPAVSSPDAIRDNIIDFESQLKNTEGAFLGDSDMCPLKHTFSDGIYVREIFIPAGTFIVGKIHKHKHPNFLMSGEVDVITESGSESLVGPMSIMSPAGTKRALYAKSDLTWITVHSNPTNTQDLKKLEEIVIADSYEEYEKFVDSKKTLLNKISYFVKNSLKKRRLE